MRGHVRRNGERWQYVFDIGPDQTGRRRQKTKSGFRTETEAQKAMRRAITRWEEEGSRAGDRIPLARFLTETWLPQKRHELAETTWVSYTGLVASHVVRDPIGHIAIGDLTPAHVSALYDRMAAKPGRGGRAGLSRKTLLLVHRILKPALYAAKDAGLITSSPMEKMRAPKSGGIRTPFSVWTGPEAQQFIQHVASSGSSRMTPLYLAALTTGARRGEVVGLKWRNVFLDEASPYIRISKVLASAGYRVIEKDPKSNSSRRNISLSPTGRAAFEQARRRQQQDREDCRLQGRPWVNSGYVFTKPTGEPLHPDYVSQRFAQDVKAAGVPRITFHEMRHTFATTALSRGQNLKTVSEALGHSGVEVTLSVYSHTLPGMHAETVSVVDEALFGGANGAGVISGVITGLATAPPEHP